MTDGEYADSLARALYRCTQLEIEISHLKRDNERLRAENARLREALKLCDEAMAWCLGGEPIDTLMIQARRAASAAICEGGR